MTIIPDLSDVVSPELRHKLYTAFAWASAAVFIASIMLASAGVVTPLVLTVINAGVNGFGMVMGFIARDNTPTYPDDEEMFIEE